MTQLLVRTFLVIALVAPGSVVLANGRAPITNGVFFHPTDNSSIFIRTTFGIVISHDNGCSFRWVCEQNVGYGGTFDPKYAIGTDGTIYATTFEGLRVSRDGACSFSTATAELPVDDPNRIAEVWVDALDIGPTGEVWVATAETGKPNNVYRSSDNGVSFASRNLLSPTIWWKSVRVAPTNPMRVYVSGYEIGKTPLAHLFVTTDGGEVWTEASVAGMQFATTPVVLVAAVSPTDPMVLFVISVGANATRGDRLYRSIDGGTSFTEVLVAANSIRDVVFRDANTVLVVAGSDGTFQSIDGGATFAPLVGSPQLECLGKRSDGTVVGCGANWEPDFKAVATTGNLADWNKTFRFVELAGPLECPDGTMQRDVCDQELWPALQQQFATKGPTDPACSAPQEPVDGPVEVKADGGCCDASSGPATAMLFACMTLIVLLRARRR